MKLLFACLLIIPGTLTAQDNKFSFGLSAPFAAKFKFAGQSGNRFSPLGLAGIAFSFRLNGITPEALSMLHQVGFVYDGLSYKVGTGDVITIEQYDIWIEPQIVFPTKRNDLQVSIGIGGYYAAAFDISRSNTQLQGGFYINVDSSKRVLNESYRTIRPFVSASIVYSYNKNYQFALKLRQSMRAYFEDSPEITYSILGNPRHLNVSYQPTFIEVSVSFFFNDSRKRD